MNFPVRELSASDFPARLKEISDPPKKLFIRGDLPSSEGAYLLTVVGSRRHSSYGEAVCDELLSSLAGRDVVIVSGLALGIDTLAHKSALKYGLKTISVPGSGINDETIYPAINKRLAQNILDNGGCLLSEYEPDTPAAPWTFPRRNRIMAGISRATLVIEAEERSGTLITARLALEYNRDVLAVPGSIHSVASKGTNRLIKEGATPISSGSELLEAIGLCGDTQIGTAITLSKIEALVQDALRFGPTEKDILQSKVGLSISDLNIVLTQMEIKGFISEAFGKIKSNLSDN